MNISLDYYRTFYFVAKYGTISAAAERLYISQPAITQTIQKLEDILEVKLFNRSTKGVKLTEDGDILYKYIENSILLLDNVEEKLKSIKELKEGSINVKSSSYLTEAILQESLVEFSKKYPNVKISISSGSADKVLNQVSIGEIDIALINLPYNNPYKNIQIKECFQREYIFAMSKEYLEKNNVVINTIEDIKKYYTIFPYKESSQKGVLNNITDCFLDYKPNLEISSDSPRLEMLKRGCGITYIDKKQVKKELKSGEIVEIKLKEKFIGKVGIATLLHTFTSYAVDEMVKSINKYIN